MNRHKIYPLIKKYFDGRVQPHEITCTLDRPNPQPLRHGLRATETRSRGEEKVVVNEAKTLVPICIGKVSEVEGG